MVAPEDAWTKARERFVEGLEEPERRMFAEASLENIFYSASAAQKIHQESSRSRCLASKLDTLLAGIDQYGKAMDVLSQASPFVCPLWGALRVVIHLSSQFQTYFNVLIDMFEQMGDVIPRFQVYETIFSSNPRLIQSLTNAYLDVAKLCINAKTVFKRARKSGANARILFKLSWKPVEQQFGTLMKDFRRHRRSVEKEAELAHFMEAEKARAVERVYKEQHDKQKSEAERIRLLSLLTSIQWKQQHHRILDMRYPGTGNWILTKEVFEQWKLARGTLQQRCLWCHGIPGSGKTVLTASVVDALTQQLDRQYIAVAYFYCDYADQETLDDSVILGTIIQQLLIDRNGLEESIATKIREAYDDGIQKASPTDLIMILERIILDHNRCVYIAIDGIDEASANAQERLFSNLAKLSASCNTLLRLYISTRDIPLISRHFPFCLTVDVSESRVPEDIEHYVKASVQQRLHDLPVMANYPYLEECTVHELTVKAKGLFLWVSLQIEELCNASHSERSYVSALQDLPEGLTATYERIYQKIARRSSHQKALAERIFNWTICAKRPLRFEELKEAVAVDMDDVSWDRRKISAETDGKRFLGVCSNLAVFHERDGTVRLAHHTVEKFLRQHKSDHVQTDARIGGICLTYLGFSDFETQLTATRKQQDVFGSQSSREAFFHRIPGLLGISNSVYDFAFRLFDRYRKPSLPDIDHAIDYAELIRRYRKKPPPESLAQKYQLLDYVLANWIWHAKSFDGKTLASWSKFRNFVFHKSLPFDFRPWDNLKGPQNLPHVAIFLWALNNSHLPLLLLLRDLSGPGSLKSYMLFCCYQSEAHLSKPYVRVRNLAAEFRKILDAYDSPVVRILSEGTAEIREFLLQEDPSIISNQDIMIHALCHPNPGLIEFLLRAGAKFQKADFDASNTLHHASRSGNQKLVKWLLNQGADPNARLFQDERGRTPLFEVIMDAKSRNTGTRGLVVNDDSLISPIDMIKLLLDSGADPNAKQIGGETVLHNAISLTEVYVRLLLSRGADVDARNEQKQSVLDLAVDTSDRMIDVLVEYNVNLEAKDSDGQTALLKAAQIESGNAARIMTLIGHGADVHVKDLAGRTILHHIRNSTVDTLRHLLELGVDANAKDDGGATPIDFAVRQSDNAKYSLLLEFGATSGGESTPPMIEAATLGNTELIDLLFRTGTNPDNSGNSKLSALSSALKHDNKDTAAALLKAGADPNLIDLSNVPPLSRAIMRRDQDMIKMLIEAGAIIQPPDNISLSPMCIAIGSGDVSMVEFLMQQGAEISRIRRSDLDNLRAGDTRMRNFLTGLGVPFTIINPDYYADDDIAAIEWRGSAA